jgi:hypothetical protein
MTVTRQQAIQLVYALMYGASKTAHLRLDEPAPAQLITSVRRLLDADVARARASKGAKPACTLAFYDELPAGTGHEVQYAPYRVFNLAVAHELARFGCKQGEVVELIATIQDKLKGAFIRANDSLKTWKHSTFTQSAEDGQILSPSDRREQLKIYLALRRVEATEKTVEYFGASVKEGTRINHVETIYGPEELATFFSKELTGGLFGAFIMELSELAARVSELVQYAPPLKRGRQPSEPPPNWGDVVAQFRVRDPDHG